MTTSITGPLLFVERVQGVGYDEIVDVLLPNGEVRRGQVLEVSGDRAVVQVFAGTRGMGLEDTWVRFRGDVARLGVSLDMLGRTLDGSGQPIDGGAPIAAQAQLDINGLPMADDPTIERLLTPRAALTTAELLAFDQGMHVLVIMTDMTNYCEALRDVSSAREEVPGRRGYPGYMYTDLASLYERASRIRGRPGSVTQLVILSMSDDDITHPIPDLTGYITEGQIVLSRELHRRGIRPPIDALPCLSRLMNAGIGKGKTRADHRSVADKLYTFYVQGRDLRRLVAIVGEDALTQEDRRYLDFAAHFEQELINQGAANRSIEETLDLAWRLLSEFTIAELKRIKPELIRRYLPTMPPQTSGVVTAEAPTP